MLVFSTDSMSIGYLPPILRVLFLCLPVALCDVEPRNPVLVQLVADPYLDGPLFEAAEAAVAEEADLARALIGLQEDGDLRSACMSSRLW